MRFFVFALLFFSVLPACATSLRIPTGIAVASPCEKGVKFTAYNEGGDKVGEICVAETPTPNELRLTEDQRDAICKGGE